MCGASPFAPSDGFFLPISSWNNNRKKNLSHQLSPITTNLRNYDGPRNGGELANQAGDKGPDRKNSQWQAWHAGSGQDFFAGRPQKSAAVASFERLDSRHVNDNVPFGGMALTFGVFDSRREPLLPTPGLHSPFARADSTLALGFGESWAGLLLTKTAAASATNASQGKVMSE